MPGKTLLVAYPDAKSPDLGVAIASTFAVRGFTHVALISPDSEQLSKDEDHVLDAIQERGYSCQTKTIAVDLSSPDSSKKLLQEVNGWGSLECIFWDGSASKSESWAPTLTAVVKEALPPSLIVAGTSLGIESDTKEQIAGEVHMVLLQAEGKSTEDLADSAWELYAQRKGA